MVVRPSSIGDEPRRRVAVTRLREWVLARGRVATDDVPDDLPEWSSDDPRTTDGWSRDARPAPVDGDCAAPDRGCAHRMGPTVDPALRTAGGASSPARRSSWRANGTRALGARAAGPSPTGRGCSASDCGARAQCQMYVQCRKARSASCSCETFAGQTQPADASTEGGA